MTYKPGSVGPRKTRRGDHSSEAPVARTLMQPTRMTWPQNRLGQAPRHPYLVLLPVGCTVRPLLPAARCALTAPFHPYLGKPRRFAFCGTFPGVAPGGR